VGFGVKTWGKEASWKT